MTRKPRSRTMPEALRAVGLAREPERCAVHPERRKPCRACAVAYGRALAQRDTQQREAQRAEHAAYIAAGGRVHAAR